MFDRRRVVGGAAAAFGSLALSAPRVLAQSKTPTKIRYNEVVRSILYAPAYVAITKGYFVEAGLEPTMTTAQGGDKSMAALLSGAADIALMGPEAAIYVQISDSPTKARIFCGLTATDGFMLVGREKADKFDWKALKGKEVLGFRPGSTPLLFLEAAMRKNGLDPQTDVKLINNVGIPARVGAWLAGQGQYAIFIEPDASQLELDGKAHFLASIGETVGFADYTAFMATDKYIHDNPTIIQAWTNAIAKAMTWTASAPAAEISAVLQQYFPGVSAQALTAAAQRYQRLKIWKSTPVIEPAAMDKFQDILVQGHVLDANKRVKFDDLITNAFAKKAT
ncbi:MAG TPA: ABC transporter substrate-binding protein [Xanthobacteraceae bacterium]|nr:ABC transporter substrate-binding protein [Xanthobacteraceae bacterium]